jgi:hypothetical protein
MKLIFTSLCALIIPLVILPTASAVEYVTISGKVVDNSGQPKRIIYLVSTLNETTLGQTKTEDVNFTLQVPKDVKIKLNFIYYSNLSINGQYLISAGWQIEKTFTKDENLNFMIPNMVKITGRVQNYSGNPYYRASINYGSGAALDHDPVDVNGNGQLWNGNGLASQAIVNNDGSFILYTFKAAAVNYVNRFRVSVTSQENSNSIWFISAAYKSLADDNLLFCVRSENESNLNPPSNCMKDQATEVLEIETSKQKSTNSVQQLEYDSVLKDYQNMMIRISNLRVKYPNQSDLLAMEQKNKSLPIILGSNLTTAKFNIISVNRWLNTNEKIWEKTQKTIIKCTKGKITKKVSGTNPKCPKGFKLGS